MRGVSFKILRTTQNMLWQILKCIDIKSYYWLLIPNQSEVWGSLSKDSLWNTTFCDGESFFHFVKSTHFIISLKLQAYSVATKELFDIHTYEEFLKSDCQLLLLIYDCEFVEIFAKDPSVISDIYKNAILCNYANISYITDQNDGRIKMDVR